MPKAWLSMQDVAIRVVPNIIDVGIYMTTR
jgi:hypothetical protein